MKVLPVIFASRLALVYLVSASPVCGQIPYMTPQWKREIANGYLPYHRLVTADFPINDRAHPGQVMYTHGFFHFDYKPDWTIRDGRFTLRIKEWSIRSGFDQKRSSRKSWYKVTGPILRHEQGHLDIHELYSRRLASIELDELPTGEGTSARLAANDLKNKLQRLADRFARDEQAEQDAYDLATTHGLNELKQRKWAAAIQKRLKQAGISF